MASKMLVGAVLALALDGASLRTTIDAEIRAGWEARKLAPASRSDDASFLRRITLDLLGTVPAADEVRAFLADPDPAKRAKFADRLLEDPRFAARQAAVWDLVLFGRNAPQEVQKRDVFRAWLAERFAKNVPYDQWVREILRAEGDSQASGAPYFLLQFRGKPLESAVAVSRVFMGTQLQCAECHDHPFDKWTQKDFYGLAAFFARLTVVESGADGKKKLVIAEKSTGDLMFTGPATDQKPGQKGEPVAARFLGGDEVAEPAVPKGFKEPDFKGKEAPPKPLFSRKEKLADWVASPENPWLAKALANRLWAQFMGRGLVHPVDDLREEKAASHPGLLKALTDRLVATKFDLRGFIRELVLSETYQLASTGGTGEPVAFERARLRPLSAEELYASIRAAAGAESADKSSSLEYFVRHFGSVTDGRGEYQGGIGERLFMNNGGQLRQLLQRKPGNLADRVATSSAPVEERVDLLFLSVLSRLPRPAERERFAAHLKSTAAKPDTLVEEAIWALVSSAEFRFNH
jgi:hypothetical protein